MFTGPDGRGLVAMGPYMVDALFVGLGCDVVCARCTLCTLGAFEAVDCPAMVGALPGVLTYLCLDAIDGGAFETADVDAALVLPAIDVARDGGTVVLADVTALPRGSVGDSDSTSKKGEPLLDLSPCDISSCPLL